MHCGCVPFPPGETKHGKIAFVHTHDTQASRNHLLNISLSPAARTLMLLAPHHSLWLRSAHHAIIRSATQIIRACKISPDYWQNVQSYLFWCCLHWLQGNCVIAEGVVIDVVAIDVRLKAHRVRRDSQACTMARGPIICGSDPSRSRNRCMQPRQNKPPRPSARPAQNLHAD